MNRNFQIRDTSDAAILGAAITGEADVICTLDSDFYTAEVAAICAAMKIVVLDDAALLSRIRR